MKLFCAERGGHGASQAVRALLGYAVNDMYGICMPEIRKTQTGKPFFPDRPDICFSLSHTKTHLLVAVSETPVGADVETVRLVRPGTAARVCTPEELRVFDFFELWVLKESYVKLSGETAVDIRSLVFGRDAGEIRTPDGATTARLFTTIPGCAAAVCSRGATIPEDIVVADLSKIICKY